MTRITSSQEQAGLQQRARNRLYFAKGRSALLALVSNRVRRFVAAGIVAAFALHAAPSHSTPVEVEFSYSLVATNGVTDANGSGKFSYDSSRASVGLPNLSS